MWDHVLLGGGECRDSSIMEWEECRIGRTLCNLILLVEHYGLIRTYDKECID